MSCCEILKRTLCQLTLILSQENVCGYKLLFYYIFEECTLHICMYTYSTACLYKTVDDVERSMAFTSYRSSIIITRLLKFLNGVLARCYLQKLYPDFKLINNVHIARQTSRTVVLDTKLQYCNVKSGSM